MQTTDVLAIFLAADALPRDALAELIDAAVKQDLVPDEVLFICRETARKAVAEAITRDAELQGMRQRLARHATVTVAGFASDGTETSRSAILGTPDPSNMTLGEFGRRAVTAIFRQHGGFVEANSNYHFKNPSKRHTDRFIRLSNLLVNSTEISLIAMTALQFVPSDATLVHVDTPAMFSVVSAINEHRRSLTPKLPAIRCESFRSYLGVDSHSFTSASSSVVLISATSSGSLAAKIAGRGVEADRIAQILYLGKADHGLNVAVDLSQDHIDNPQGIADQRETFMEGACKLCDDGSIAVPLIGDQFDMGGPEFEPLTVNKNDAPPALSDTMKRVACSGALSISLATGAVRRQHLVDPVELLAWSAFQQRLSYFSRRYAPSSVRELILLDEASRPFASAITLAAEVTPRVLARDQVDGLAVADVDATGAPLDGMPIIIAAAVIESGRSLRDISRDLRRARPHSPQIYLVGFAKNASPVKRQELERTLVQTSEAAQHAFAAVEEMLLPPSGTPNAWAAERDFLDRASSHPTGLSAALKARRGTLQLASTPLRDDLFVPNAAAAMTLQPGFVFWPPTSSIATDPAASQSDVFFTISSVLQRLRTNPPSAGVQALRNNWFQQTLLDPANLGRFNDGVIQASLLRAARPTEIDYSKTDAVSLDAVRVAKRIIEASHRPAGEAAAELLIALGSRRLKIPSADLPGLLSPRPTHPPLVAELAAICSALLL